MYERIAKKIKSDFRRRQFELSAGLFGSLYTIDQVYKAALEGGKLEEVRQAMILAKFQSKTAQRFLSKKELKEAKEMLELLEAHEKDGKVLNLRFSPRQYAIVRMVLLEQFKEQRKIPSKAREQYVIALQIVLEALVSDTLRNIFGHKKEIMKSHTATLRDEELIDLLDTNSVLETLREKKIRDLMNGTRTWRDYLINNLKLGIRIPSDLVELDLVRNCLIHNRGLTSKELRDNVKKIDIRWEIESM
jgi:hypothetical protein